MPIISLHNTHVLFVHVPKCGGSSIEAFFRDNGCGLSFKHNAFYTDKALGFPCSPQHFHMDVLNRLFARNVFSYKFAIVRDPLERLKSEYRMRMGNRRPPKIVEFGEWVQRCFSAYKKDEYYLDNHIRPQSEFIDESVETFKLEDGLQRPIARACEVLSLRPPEGVNIRRNRGKHVAISLDTSTADRIFEFYYNDYVNFRYQFKVH